jgi:AcrR family transcriptional regulator
MSTSRGKQPLGLRERKKAKTRAAIQEHALRLFIEQGYAETTVDQIAEAAEVSQSTFFRYFATKEETVFYDRYDPILIDAFVRQPPDASPLAAVRAAIHEVFDRLPAAESDLEQARQQLILKVPELRVAVLDQFGSGLSLLTDALAQRTGRAPDDFALRTWAGAVLGVAYSSFFEARNTGGDFMEHIDRAFALLEAGLPL